MIKQVYSLVMEDSFEVLGVRIETINNKKFDLELEIFHSIVKMDVATLEPIELMEHGDKLVSEEEFYQGVLVEDASENPKLLEQLKGFFISTKPEEITDKKLLEKRKRRLFELKQAFYGYLPHAMLDSFAEYHLNHFEGNQGVYDTLSEERVKEIHTYSRWRSRMLFEEKNNYQLLTVKPNKAEKLLTLMGTAEDWRYDGLIDLGFRGAGHCTLGHALRYQHFAYSPSTRTHIAFGKDCVADFFDVPPRVLNEIINAQEIILKETKAIVFLLNTGNVQDYYKDAGVDTNVIQELIDSSIFKEQKKKAEWLIRMAGFSRVGLPLTRSMMKWLKHLTPELAEFKKSQLDKDKVGKVLKDLEKTSFPQEDLKDLLTKPPQSIFQLLAKKLILQEDYGHDVVDLYFKKYHDTVLDLQYHFEKTSNRPLMTFLNDVNKTFPFIKDEKRGVLRLISAEDKTMPFRVFMDGSIFRKESHVLFSALYKVLSRPSEHRGVSNNVFTITSAERAYCGTIVNAMNTIDTLKFNVFTSDFMKEIKYLQDGFPTVQTIEDSLRYTTFPLKTDSSVSPKKQATVDNDVNHVTPIIEGSKLERDESNPTLYNIISELEALRNTPIVKINPFTYEILATVHKSGRISDKQETYIRKGFTQVIENIEDYAMAHGVISKKSKVLDIIETYRKHGKMSDKQLAYITKANQIILDHINDKTMEKDDALPF